MLIDNQQNLTPIHSVNSAYKKIVVIFIIAILVLLSIILYFSLSKAEIYLKTKTQPAKINFSVQVKEDVSNNNYLETNILQGRILELTMEKTKEFAVKGKEESSGKYGGTMTVINDKKEPQSLVKTTRFQSQNGKIFRTQSAVIVPAKGQIEVSVIADGEGEEYAVTNGKFIIPGLNESSQKLVYGELKSPMTKESRTVYIVSQEDIDNAQKELSDELKQEGGEKIKTLLLNDEKLEDQDITTKIISGEASKKIGDEINKFNYSIKLQVIGVIFNKDELLTLTKNSLKNQIDKSQELLSYNDESFKYTISSYVPEEKNATLEVEMSANVAQNSNSEIFNTERLKNLDQEEIIDYFKNVETVESIDVKFSPFWVKKAPKFSNHIEIIIE